MPSDDEFSLPSHGSSDTDTNSDADLDAALTEDDGPTAASVAARARAVLAEKYRQCPRRVGGKAYRSNQQKFVTWVIQQRELGNIQDGPIYTTRENIDLFFSEVMTKERWVRNSMTRMVSSLQALCKYVEHVGEGFKVDNDHIQSCIELQQDNWLEWKRANESFRDPLDDLKTDMLKHEDREAFMRHILDTNNTRWQEFCLTFTGCESMMMRKETMDKLRLACHHCNDTHGPMSEGPYDRKMLAVAQDPLQSKSKDADKRVYGVWRHKHWYLCYTSMFSMTLLARLHSTYSDIAFVKPPPGGAANIRGAPAWWSVRILTEWSTTSAAGTAYKRIFDDLGISWQKVVHFRRAGTEHASRAGLIPDVIATMTKHSIKGDKAINKSYLTELSPQVLSVMSGTDEKDYFVPRT